MLVVKRIHVRFALVVDEGVDRSKIERAMSTFAEYCPVYRSISAAIDFSFDIELAGAG